MNYEQVKAIEAKNKQRILAVCPKMVDGSGIYVFTRMDENGIRFAYVGKSGAQGGVLSRCANHLNGYKQWIDLSLRKHGLYDSEKRPYGWKVEALVYCETKYLDEYERFYIKVYANAGYQLRNIESGGTTGKTDINERKPSMGYWDGVKQGYENARREVKHLFDLHLKAVIKANKPHKTQEKALQKFYDFLEGNNG